MGFRIRKGGNRRNYLKFADGSLKKTAGQVYTHWTFATGESVPITFEVLDVCCTDIVIGDEIIWDHEVFEAHASSIVARTTENEAFELAPFGFLRPWESRMNDSVRSFTRRQLEGNSGSSKAYDHRRLISPGEQESSVLRAEEEQRHDQYNHDTNFGADATPIERELEAQRRAAYNERIRSLMLQEQLSIPKQLEETRTTSVLRGLKHRLKKVSRSGKSE